MIPDFLRKSFYPFARFWFFLTPFLHYKKMKAMKEKIEKSFNEKMDSSAERMMLNLASNDVMFYFLAIVAALVICLSAFVELLAA